MFIGNNDAIVLLYLILSVIWLIIIIFSDLIFGGDFSSIVFYVIFTIVYIPIAYYYISEGNVARIQESLYFTILILIVYVVFQGIKVTALLINTI